MKKIAVFGEENEAMKVKMGLSEIGKPLQIDIFNDEEKFLKEYEKGQYEMAILIRESILQGAVRPLSVVERISGKGSFGKIIFLGRFKTEREEAYRRGVDLFIDIDDVGLFQKIGKALEKPRLAVNSWHYYHVLKDQWVNIILFSSVRTDKDVLISFKPHIILISSEGIQEGEFEGVLEIRGMIPTTDIILIIQGGKEDLEKQALRYGFTNLYDEREGQEEIRKRIMDELNKKWKEEINI